MSKEYTLHAMDTKSRNALAQERGRKGEDAAEQYLRDCGLRVLARNWRQGRLELDIVCRERDTVVFVEVKTRKADSLTRPDEALSVRKRATLLRAANAWLAAHGAWSQPCRFDVVAVVCDKTTMTVEHIRHAFDANTSVGGRHSAWQPW